jgi:hypothetical protein
MASEVNDRQAYGSDAERDEYGMEWNAVGPALRFLLLSIATGVDLLLAEKRNDCWYYLVGSALWVSSRDCAALYCAVLCCAVMSNRNYSYSCGDSTRLDEISLE